MTPGLYTQPKYYQRATDGEQIDYFLRARGGCVESRDRLWAHMFSLILARLSRSKVPADLYPDIFQEWAVWFFSNLDKYDETRRIPPGAFYNPRTMGVIRDFTGNFCYPVKIGWREFKAPPKAVDLSLFADFLADLNMEVQ